MMSLYLGLALLVGAIWLFFKWQNSYWQRRGVRGPAGQPLFGNMYQYFMMRRHFGELYDDMYNAYPKAAYIGFYKFGTPAVLVRSIDLMRTVLVDQFSAFANNDMHLDPALDPLLARNPFFCEGDEWRRMRGQFGPVFSAARVRQAVPVVAGVCRKLVQHVDGRLGEQVDTKEMFTKFTVESVAACAFSVEANAFTNPNSEFLYNSQRIFDTSALQNFRFTVVTFLPIFGKLFKLSLVTASVDRWVREMVKHVTTQRQQSAQNQRNDFMQSLLEANAKTSDAPIDADILAGHSFSFMTEGYETSSTTMTFCMYELARNPEVQERCRAEVDVAFAASGNELTEDGMQKLHLLEQAIYETLRMHSVVFSIQRVATRDVELPAQFGGCDERRVVLPKGTPIILPVYSLHKDPTVFPDPDQFRPERFSEAGRSERNRYAFLGFGEGPRICPGIRFGVLQVKAALATVLLNYRVRMGAKTPEPLTFAKGGVIKTCTDGIWLRFERR